MKKTMNPLFELYTCILSSPFFSSVFPPHYPSLLIANILPLTFSKTCSPPPPQSIMMLASTFLLSSF